MPGRILNGALLGNGTGNIRKALKMHDHLQNTVVGEWSIVVSRSKWNKRAPLVGIVMKPQREQAL